MPALKKLPINSTFFPGEDTADDSHVENVRPTTGRRQPSALDVNDNETQSPTRATTVVGSDDGLDLEDVDSQGKEQGGRKKVILLHFEKDDPEDPMNWGNGRKWSITALLCMMTMLIGLSTSAYSNTVGGMSEEYGVSQVAAQVGMFTFNAACAIAPLFLAPLCELIGRREVYLSAYFLFVLTFLFLALGKNIGTQIVGRLFAGLFGSCGTILVGGTLADIWDTHERSIPMSCFTFVAIQGTITAPLYCGYISASIGWRWIEWIHMIANGALLIVEFFFLKETRGAKILMDRAKALRKETGDNRYRAPAELESENVKDLLKQSCTRAIKLLVKEPVLFCFGFWIAFAWGVTFLFLSVIPLTFQGNHGWSEGNGGLPYIALIIGCILGFITDFWATAKYNRETKKNGGVAIPEYRLWGAMHFAMFLPIGLFIFSFTQYEFVHWIAPTIALVPIILGIYAIFNAVYNYTSDSYGELSSSAIAGQGFMRNMFAASFPLFGRQMFQKMGFQWAGLLLALVGSLMVPLPFILFKYGARIRKSSAYASATTGSNSGTGEEKLADEENQAGVSGEKKDPSKRHPQLESKAIALQI